MNPDAIPWLFSLEHLGMKFGLENITKLLAELDDPHRAFAAIHVGGTNGKGSVTAILETALRHAGYRSARYTSPHLERIEERFVVAGHEIPTTTLRTAAATVRDVTGRLLARGELSGLPTFFEATTAVAFELFRMERVEVAVVEVGLGGRLDSTNVLQPMVSVVTTIAFDHEALLGHTLAEIAAEKAGIIKPRTPVVIGRLPGEAESVIARVAADRQAPLVKAHDLAHGVDGMSPRLRGAHQRDNAIVALAVLEVLRGGPFAVSREDAQYAVEHVDWPGRLEHARIGGCDVLFDAAHNPEGARALAAYLREAGWSDATLIFGAMADKDIRSMLAELVPVVRRIVCTTPGTPRAADAETVAAIARALGGPAAVDTLADPHAAFAAARAASGRVVVAGSMFLIGPLRGILR